MPQRPRISSGGASGFALISRQERIALIIVFVIAIGYAVWHQIHNAPPKIDLGSDIPAKGKTISVEVEGAVVRPGMVTVPIGSHASDAIMAAGGFLPTANQDAVTLGQPVNDGTKLKVPFIGQAVSNGTLSSGEAVPEKLPGPVPIGLININTASLAEIAKLPDIGQALAERIVDYRTKNGPFQNIEDITHVPGIGQAKFMRIRQFITVGN